MDAILTALLRKFIFMCILFGGYYFLDRFILSGFNTGKVIANDPKAIAILLGLVCLAVALS